MNKHRLIPVIVVAFICITNNLNAQESGAQKVTKSRSNIQNNRTCVVKFESVDEGCAVSFEGVTPPRDAASGLPTGKRTHKPLYIVHSLDNSVTEPKNFGEIASNRSGGKATFNDISVMISLKGRNTRLVGNGGEFTFPSDLADGEYEMVCTWSWGASNSKMKNGTVKFIVEMKGGSCFGINEQGVK